MGEANMEGQTRVRKVISNGTYIPILEIEPSQRSDKCSWCGALNITDKKPEQDVGKSNLNSGICSPHAKWFINR